MSKLDRISIGSGIAASIFLLLIGVIITVQIVARLFGKQIPSSDDFAGWSMVASIFLALPYSLGQGDHIRITLLLNSLPNHAKVIYEALATSISLVLSAWGTYYTVVFVYESYIYGEISQGILPVPLWIPQVSMPIGMALLTAMLAQRLTRCLRSVPLEVSHD